jgi:hypothetical protein
MPDLTGGPGRSRESCLTIELQSAASTLRASDGREIRFARAALTMRNDCPAELIDLVPHASLGQEGGTVQDVSRAFPGTAAVLPPGGFLQWDVYDLLLPAHPGTASKVHMFGYRAALNWRFELAAWAEYRLPDAPEPVRTPIARWALRWSLVEAAGGAVALTIEERTG